MTSSRQSGTNYGRRFFWFAVLIVLGIGLYSAGWFYVAQKAVDQVQANVASMNRDGKRANCEAPEARGYPFRIGIFCRTVMFEDARKGIFAQAGELRSAAQIYQPWRVIGELDGPARLEVPGLNALALNWDALRASVRLARPLPERLSAEATGLSVQIDEQGEKDRALAFAEGAELHLRPHGNDLDIALRFSKLVPDATLGVTVPPLSGLLDFLLTDGALPGVLDGSLRGHSGNIRNLTISADGGVEITLSGPVAIDEAGLLDAELSLSVREPMALAKILGDAAPHARREIALALSALAQTGASGLPVRITKGQARIGFIPLGAIPAL